MSKNVYKTAQGQIINMDNLRLFNEEVAAVGNMAVNARGDHIAPNGLVTKHKSEIMKDRYQHHNQPNRKI